jgi:WD40 repeat protein
MGILAENLSRLSDAARIYRLKELPQTLAQNSKTEKLYKYLTDFDFLEAKINYLDVQSLIEDYEQALELSITLPEEKKSVLKLIQDAIRKSANILQDNPKQFPGQLSGRLSPHKNLDLLTPLLEQISHFTEYPWLRPLSVGSMGLIAAGQSLVRSINTKHIAKISATAIRADGKFAITAGSEDGMLRLWDVYTGKLSKEFEMEESWDITRLGLKTFIGDDADRISDDELRKGTFAKAIAISPDGNWLLIGSDTNQPQARNCPVELWSTDKNNIKSVDTFLIGHKDNITSLSLSSNAKLAVIGTEEGELSVIDLEARREKNEDYDWYKENFNEFCGVIILERNGNGFSSIIDVAICPDARWIVAAREGVVESWDLTNGCLNKVLNVQEIGKVNALNVDSNGIVSILFEDCIVRQYMMGSRKLGRFRKSEGMLMLDRAYYADREWRILRKFLGQMPFLRKYLDGDTFHRRDLDWDEDKRFVLTPMAWIIFRRVFVSIGHRLTKRIYAKELTTKTLNLPFGIKPNAISSDACWAVSISNNTEIQLWDLSVNSETIK